MSLLPNTPQKIFSNNLNSYNKTKLPDSPIEPGFNSRSCVAPNALSQPKYVKEHNLRSGECERWDNSYRSKVFYIRYSDENVRLNELINYKTEIET
jgi:hypothetical protein